MQCNYQTILALRTQNVFWIEPLDVTVGQPLITAVQQGVSMDHTASITADGADHHDLHHIYFSLLALVKYHPPDK